MLGADEEFYFNLWIYTGYSHYTWGGLRVEGNFTWMVQRLVGTDPDDDDSWTNNESIATVSASEIEYNLCNTEVDPSHDPNIGGDWRGNFKIPVRFTGRGETFRVAAVSMNGGVANRQVTVYSHAVTVIPPSALTLGILLTLRDIHITAGNTTTAHWFSNLTDEQATKNEPDIYFNIDVYWHNGNSYPPTDNAPNVSNTNAWTKVGNTISLRSSVSDPVTSCDLTGLTAVSRGSGYSYAVRVYAEYEDAAHAKATYETWAYMYVISRPAVVDLDSDLTLYWTEITGADGVTLEWTVENPDAANLNRAQFQLTVTNNDTGLPVASADINDNDIIWTVDGDDSNTRRGRYTFHFAENGIEEAGSDGIN